MEKKRFFPRTKTAVILVGGQGTRLAGKFPDVIKPLTPIGGKPFLARLVRHLESFGIDEIILVAGHRAEQIKDFAETQKNIKVLIEEKPLGTGGAFRFALPHVRGDIFLGLNGDTFFEGDLEPILTAAVQPESPMSVGIVEVANVSRFGSVELDPKTNQIFKFVEKGKSGRGYVNCGIYQIHRSSFESIPEGKNISMETDILPNIRNLKAEVLKGQFYDIGLPTSHASFNADVLLRELKVTSPSAALFLSHQLAGGRTFCTPTFASNSFSDLPFRRELGLVEVEAAGWVRADERDLVLTDFAERDLLVRLGRDWGGPQVLLVSESTNLSDLVDCVVSPADWQNGLSQMTSLWNDLHLSSGEFTIYEGEKRPALFLDRDGVVIDHVDYIHRAEDVKIKDGIIGLLERAKQNGFVIVLITNQSGLGREYFSWTDHFAVTARMVELLREARVGLDVLLESPFYENSQRARGLALPHFRKPRPGMIKKAAREHGLALERSIVVGDRATDLIAGTTAGIRARFLVESPGLDQEMKKWRDWDGRNGLNKDSEVCVTKNFSEILS